MSPKGFFEARDRRSGPPRQRNKQCRESDAQDEEILMLDSLILSYRGLER
jgi:hypothetical protein